MQYPNIRFQIFIYLFYFHLHPILLVWMFILIIFLIFERNLSKELTFLLLDVINLIMPLLILIY